jgi:protein-disulfide isomerase
MNMKMPLYRSNFLMYWLVLAGLMLIVAGSCREEIIKTPLAGKSLPVFKFYLPTKLLYFSTDSIKTNRSTVFFYFLPNCPHCKTMLTEIVENRSKFNGTDFYLLTPTEFIDIKRLYEKMNLGKYDNIIVALDYNRDFMRYFGIKGVPYVVVYDKNQRLNDIFTGAVSLKQLKKSTL